MGPLVTALEVRRSALETLETWLPAYLKELGRRHERDLRPPRSWKRLADFRALRADQSPVVVVTSPGLSDQSSRDGDGSYDAAWQLNVFVVVRGQSYEETADLVALYVAAARVVLVQQGLGLDGARRPRWAGEGYNEIAADKSRTIGAGVVSFTVYIGDVLDDDAGPLTLPDPPEYEFPEDPIAEEALVEVVPRDEM